MAERRMFSRALIDSDNFLEMPLSAQALYFHLAMQADDDGFVNSPKKICRMIGVADEDLNTLIKKQFVIVFETGVIVITHWKLHNYIPKDRYKPTIYAEEKNKITLNDNNVYTVCIQSDDEMDTQVRLDKDRLDKDRLDKDSIKKESKKEARACYKDIFLAFGFSEKINGLIENYIQMRKMRKNAPTNKALELVCKKLAAHDEAAQIEMLEKSIENGWSGIFEPKTIKKEPQETVNKKQVSPESQRVVSGDVFSDRMF